MAYIVFSLLLISLYSSYVHFYQKQGFLITHANIE
jgi:hypothetical protein